MPIPNWGFYAHKKDERLKRFFFCLRPPTPTNSPDIQRKHHCLGFTVIFPDDKQSVSSRFHAWVCISDLHRSCFTVSYCVVLQSNSGEMIKNGNKEDLSPNDITQTHFSFIWNITLKRNQTSKRKAETCKLTEFQSSFCIFANINFKTWKINNIKNLKGNLLSNAKTKSFQHFSTQKSTFLVHDWSLMTKDQIETNNRLRLWIIMILLVVDTLNALSLILTRPTS